MDVSDFVFHPCGALTGCSYKKNSATKIDLLLKMHFYFHSCLLVASFHITSIYTRPRIIVVRQARPSQSVLLEAHNKHPEDQILLVSTSRGPQLGPGKKKKKKHNRLAHWSNEQIKWSSIEGIRPKNVIFSLASQKRLSMPRGHYKSCKTEIRRHSAGRNPQISNFFLLKMRWPSQHCHLQSMENSGRNKNINKQKENPVQNH